MNPVMLPLLCALACSPEEEDSGSERLVTDAGLYELSVQMSPDPPVTGDATLTVEIQDGATGDPISGATLTVVPWMPDHGHGLAEPPLVVEDQGVYTVTFAYTMPGTWELTFQVDGALGADSAVLTVEVG